MVTAFQTCDILVFAAHPDDAELACAGTIAKHTALGYSVVIIDLTEGELGTRGTVESRYAEAKKAAEILGVSARENLNLGDGFFEVESKALLALVQIIRKYQPKIVLCNAVQDRHPDHGRGSALASRACFLSGLAKIETTLNGKIQVAFRPEVVYHYIQDRFIQPDFVVDISDFMEQKRNAVLAYKSQFYNPNSEEPQTPISSPEFLEIVMQRPREFGRQAGFAYGEGFTVERYIGVNTLFDIV